MTNHPLNNLTILLFDHSLQNQIKGLGGSTLMASGTSPAESQDLQSAIDTILNKTVDLALFTNPTQVNPLFKIAIQADCEAEFRRSFQQVVIAASGTDTIKRLREFQIFPDLEVNSQEINQLVEQTAAKAQALVKIKKDRVQKAWVRINENEAPSPSQYTKELHNSLVMKACRREKNKTIPVWLMRQAGRYMAEYQMVRKKADFITMCKNPDLASEVTITAVERLGVDAAIIFSDILPILEPMGLDLVYKEGVGPLLSPTIKDAASIKALKPVDVQESMSFVMDAIRKTRQAMHPRIPLIGFCGAPFTMASYMIEGHGSKDYQEVKQIIQNDPSAWHLLMEKLIDALTNHLNAQIDAGCEIVQVFESWANALSADEYREFVLDHTRNLIRRIKKNVPVILFGSFGSEELLKVQIDSGAPILSLDWRIDIAKAAKIIGPDRVIQGNLNPAFLFSDQQTLFKETEKILNSIGSRPGFIFNLGHGIKPKTPVENVMALVDFVHGWDVK